MIPNDNESNEHNTNIEYNKNTIKIQCLAEIACAAQRVRNRYIN